MKLSNQETNKTLDGIRKGSKKVYHQVFLNHYAALCHFANRFIADKDTVEDLVQEAFISFWDKRTTFENFYAIKSYLYTSVRNNCLNHLQHLAVRKKNEDAIIYELESGYHIQNAVIEEEAFNNLYVEIKNLPKAAQEIMLLAMNGLKNPEIAEKLNISVNTVKTQKKLAYAKLKDRLSPALQYLVIFLGT